ncbi:hypothetical protein [Methylobacterium sp. ID0610]|uniref:hypothetical protein n=1 Tax=Methylobacterium carpenticola TaxID=3344827 RepID=UPI003698E87F
MRAGKPKLVAYTVAAGSGDGGELRLYAVLANDGRSAIETATQGVPDRSSVELCGHLSEKLAARLKLKPGQIKPL